MKLSTQIILAFLIVLTFSVANSFTNYRLSLKVQQNINFLSQSESVIRNSNRIHRTMLEMQSALRGYLLTSDSNFLTPYYSGLRNVPTLLKQQEEILKNNASQYKLLDSIKILHQEWIMYSQTLIENHRDTAIGGFKSSRIFEDKFKKQVGKRINDDISQKFLRLDRVEYSIRNKRSEALVASIYRTHTYSIIFTTLIIILGSISTIYIVFLISRRINSMVSLAKNISDGQFTVVKDDRNDELTDLSRSLNIMSDKLKKNISELENSNRELDKFAYVVSHDLKAPVRGIHNVVKWIEEDLAKEISVEMHKYLEIIRQRTQRMEQLINGLLHYARISEKTAPSQVDVNVLVQEVVDTIVPRNFKVSIGPMPVLYTEPIKLEQVFSNLISNAVKYTAHTNGHIEVTCEELPAYYRFSVKDNGIGIDAEYHAKIFEIFQTLREKNEKESTGLGLAIVKKIIEDQHGTILVKSKTGQGSEFIFTWRKL